MAASQVILIKQRLTRIWNNEQWQFLVAECEKPTCIHEHTFTVHGETTVDASTV